MNFLILKIRMFVNKILFAKMHWIQGDSDDELPSFMLDSTIRAAQREREEKKKEEEKAAKKA